MPNYNYFVQPFIKIKDKVQGAIFIIFENIKTKILEISDKYISAYGTASKKGYKSNAFAPILWFNVFTLPPLTTLIIFVSDVTLKYVFTILLIILILFSLVMYFLIFKKDPRLLQSEKSQIEHRKLDLMGEKGGDIKFLPFDLSQTSEIGEQDE